jgi:cobalt-zinc-cadmium efflux system outer membrane protein
MESLTLFNHFSAYGRLCAAVLTLSLAACASLPADWGRGAVAEATAARGLQPPSGDPAQLQQQLLTRPLQPDDAVSLALLNSPELSRNLASLGFAAAEVYDAARLSNPVLSAARLSSDDPAAIRPQLSLGLAFNFTELLFLPARSRLANERFEAAKLDVADQTLRLSYEVEAGWYQLAGAEQAAAMRQAIAQAARASADLAQRYFEAGNLSRRALAAEQAAASQAALDAETASAEASAARGRLHRQMGLAAEAQGWTLAAGLPQPPEQELRLPELLQLAADSRLDLAAARRRLDSVQAATGLEPRQRLLGPLELGVEYERETDGSRLLGPSLSWQLPLFNWGSGRKAQAQAQLASAEAELRASELDLQQEVGAALAELQSAQRRLRRLREELIPQREAVVAQTQRELNYMLVGAAELLLAKQQEYAAYGDYLGAVRDYWLARSALSRAVGRRLPEPEAPSGKRLDATSLLPATGTATEATHAHHHGDAP